MHFLVLFTVTRFRCIYIFSFFLLARRDISAIRGISPCESRKNTSMINFFKYQIMQMKRGLHPVKWRQVINFAQNEPRNENFCNLCWRFVKYHFSTTRAANAFLMPTLWRNFNWNNHRLNRPWILMQLTVEKEKKESILGCKKAPSRSLTSFVSPEFGISPRKHGRQTHGETSLYHDCFGQCLPWEENCAEKNKFQRP